MVKALSTGNGAWAVKILALKKGNERSAGEKPRDRTVEIRKLAPLTNNEKRRRKLDSFAEESKGRVEKIVQDAIKSVKMWQLDMLARIDVTHQHILKMHNLQNTSDCHAKGNTQSESEQPEINYEIFPSMPILIDENCNDVNESPSKPIHSPVVKRQNAVSPSSSGASSPAIIFHDIPLRKDSRFIHRFSAIKQLKFEQQDTARTSDITETVAQCDVANVKQMPKIETPKPAIFQKFFETQKLVMEKQKLVQKAGFDEAPDDESGKADHGNVSSHSAICPNL
ncbi:uncharacterized protein LOC129572034 [Sitodiplosis mosellana]|uniref:uncharacterized protein LOC129572034 n=1 Tax=Sitodiplosis mosellana TaxID=263140 RepID=UPI00244527DC|nr:uncharacterized protein LOC129572034 [Sitodiplosis mosellana]